MALPTIGVLDKDGSPQTVNTPNSGRQAAASSAASVLSTEDKAVIDAIAASLAGTLTVNAHAVTQSGTWTVQPGNTANTTAWKVDGSAVTQPVSGTVTVTNFGNALTRGAGATDSNTQRVTLGSEQLLPSAAATGLTYSRVNAAGSTNATNLKASAGNIHEIDVYNVAAYDVFLKLYNKASSPTVGTDTPVWTIPIKAGTGFSRSFISGRSFATGISYAITKLQADSDTTAVTALDLTGSIAWV